LEIGRKSLEIQIVKSLISPKTAKQKFGIQEKNLEIQISDLTLRRRLRPVRAFTFSQPCLLAGP
jgi:hypothetical protein